MSATSRSANVSCGDVTLKLTLSVAQLKKPFETAVLLPFLKAYGKRAALPLPLAITDVIAVEVDGTKLGDCSIAASIVLLTSESIPVRVHLRAGAGQPSALGDNPFATGTPFVNQAKSDVERMVDFDGKSEVERLKEKRRAARLAREADAALSDTPAPRAGAAESVSLCSGDVVTVNGLESDAGKAINGRKGTIVHYVAEKGRYAVLLDGQDGRVNIRPSNLQVFSAGTPDAVTEAEGKSKGEREGEGEGEREGEGEGEGEGEDALLAELTRLEAAVHGLGSGIQSALAELEQIDFDDVEAEEAVDSIGRAAAGLSSETGGLQARMDAIDLSHLAADSQRSVRARRKAVSATLEAEVVTALSSLSSRLALARQAVS